MYFNKLPADASVIAATTDQVEPGLIMLVTTIDDHDAGIYYVLWQAGTYSNDTHNTVRYEIMWRGSFESAMREFGNIVGECYSGPRSDKSNTDTNTDTSTDN